MKNIILLSCLLLLTSKLLGESPKEMIRTYVETQEEAVTAYDIAAYFNPPSTDPVFGTENVFNAASTAEIFIAALDATHFVVVYQDGGNSNFGAAIVGVVSGTTISSYGSENVFNSAYTFDIAVTKLDATHFVVVYRDNGNFNHGTAIVGAVSGTTISSYGSENVFNNTNPNNLSVAMLDATHFVVAYRDGGNSNHGTAIVGAVSGTTISSYGSQNVFNNANTNLISVAALDANHFVVTYKDLGNSDYGSAIVGAVSGTTITSFGSENVFNNANTNFISVVGLDATHFVVAYQDSGNSNHGAAIVGAVSGTTISSFGSENVFNNATTNTISIAALDATNFVVAYRDDGNSFNGTAIVGEVSGTTISSFGSENVFNNATTNTISVAMLDATHFVLAYRDGGNSNYGTAIVGSTVSPLPVELVSFRGKLSNDQVLLSWVTASEENNLGFEIQKSNNGVVWETIGFVDGQGTTSIPHAYEYLDTKPFSGSNYYRLQQMDFDGKYEYSQVIAVEYRNSEEQIQIFPNPSNKFINIQITNPDHQIMSVKVMDELGREVWRSDFLIGFSDWKKEIAIDKQGIYFISTQIGNEIYVERVLILGEN